MGLKAKGFLAGERSLPCCYSQQGLKTRRFQLLRVYRESSSGLSVLGWVWQPRLAIVVMKLPSGQGGRGLSNLAFAAAIASNVKTTHLHTTPNLWTPARPPGFLSSPSTLSHIPSSQINCFFASLISLTPHTRQDCRLTSSSRHLPAKGQHIPELLPNRTLVCTSASTCEANCQNGSRTQPRPHREEEPSDVGTGCPAVPASVTAN